MKFKTTLIMFIAMVILIVAYAIVGRRVPTTAQMEERGKKVFADPDFYRKDGDKKLGLSDLVTKLRLKKGDRTVTLVKKGEQDKAAWKMTEPLKVRGDKSEVNSVLSEFEWMNKDRAIREEEGGKPLDLPKYGLDKPQIEATFWIGDREWTLQVGKKTAVGAKAYVRRVGEDPVYVVSDSVIDKLDKTANKMRDKTVLPLEKDRVDKVALDYASRPGIECKRDPDGWNLARPIRDYAAKDKVEEVIDKVRDLKIDVEDFITEDASDLAKYGLDKPRVKVAITEEGSTRTLILGAAAKDKKDKLYAKRQEEPAIFALKNSVVDDLTKKVNDLRDKKALRFDTSDVEKVETTIGKEQVVVAKVGDDWKIQKPAEMDADTTEVTNFLDAIRNLEAEEWIDDVEDPAQYGMKEPSAVIRLTLKEKEGTRELTVGGLDKDKKKCYVQRAGAKHLIAVKAEFQERAAAGYLAFLKKRVLEFAKDDAKKVTVVRDGKTYLCKKEDDKWKLLSPIVWQADSSSVSDILWDLAYLDAKKFVAKAPKDLKQYGLAPPSMKCILEYEEEIKSDKTDTEDANKDTKKQEKKKRLVTKTLLIGKKKDDNSWYARIQDRDLVFLIGSSIVENLRDELASRTMFEFTRDDVKALVLAYPNKEVRLEKEGEKWMMKKPEKKPARKEDVNDVLDTMNGLRAHAIATYVTDDVAKYGLGAPRFKVTLELPDSKTTVLTVGKKKAKEDNFFATSSDSKCVYILAKYELDRLMKEKPEEKKPEPAKPGKKAEPAQPEKKTDAKGAGEEKAAPKPAAPPAKKPAASTEAKPEAKPKPEKGT